MRSIPGQGHLLGTCCARAGRHWKSTASGVSTLETARQRARPTPFCSLPDRKTNLTVYLEASLCPGSNPLSHLKASLKMAGLFLFSSASGDQLPAERRSIKKTIFGRIRDKNESLS